MEQPNEIFNEDEIAQAIKNPEAVHDFLAFADAAMAHLPVHEQSEFLAHPVTFVSKEMAFRGFDQKTLKAVREQKQYLPQNGQMGGRAVYLTNCPYASFMHQKGVIALLMRNRLIHKSPHGFIRPGSDEYKEGTAKFLASLPPNLSETQRSNALYEADNEMDLFERSGSDNPNNRILSLRLPQPIAATKVFLILENGAVREEYPPAEESSEESPSVPAETQPGS